MRPQQPWRTAFQGAQLLSLPPGEHYAIDIIDLLIPPILEFVCHQPVSSITARVLLTVLFTDIVGSTEQLSASGDAHWHRQLDVHDKVVGWLLEKYGGRRAKHTGDGINNFAVAAAPEISTAIAHLRDVLGDETYESFARAGATMTTVAIVAYALDQIDQARAQLQGVD